jgi:lysophospholipid acyltransferase (LPLAT)-like uncharacterized protein
MRIPKPFARIDVVFGSPIVLGPSKEDARRTLGDLELVLTRLGGGTSS